MSDATHASTEPPADRSEGARELQKRSHLCVVDRLTKARAALAAKPRSPAKPRNKKRARARIDKRFVLGRRISELMSLYRDRLNMTADDADPVLLAAIERAARLTALAEDASARAVRGDPDIALDDVVRISRTADLAVRRLHLDRAKQKPTSDLSSYIASRAQP